MNKPFDLEAFKNGQKALTRDGRKVTYAGWCDGLDVYHLIAHIEGNSYVSTYTPEGKNNNTYDSRADLVSMVPRHQHLIDSYKPEDTLQFKNLKYPLQGWIECSGRPEWNEDYDYRIHPHNDLIKAWKKGAKIEAYIVGDWVEERNPDWYEDTQYRIKPATKTVHEWIYEASVGNVNYFVSTWLTDENVEYFFGIDTPKQKYKTGRSWEVEA